MAEQNVNIRVTGLGLGGGTPRVSTSGALGGMLGGLKDAISTGGKGGLGKMATGLGSMVGMMGGMLGMLGAVVGFLAVLVASSKMLQVTIGRLMKFIMLILRPIGDAIGILLMPLMMLIRPLALFVNALFRPFMREARDAMRTAMRFYRLGGEENQAKGNELMFIGLQLLATPFLKIITIALGELGKMWVSNIEFMMQSFRRIVFSIVDTILSMIPMSEKARELWKGFMGEGGAVDVGISEAADAARDNITGMVSNILSALDENAQSLIARKEELKKMVEKQEDAVKKLADTSTKSDETVTTIKDNMQKVGDAWVDASDVAYRGAQALLQNLQTLIDRGTPPSMTPKQVVDVGNAALLLARREAAEEKAFAGAKARALGYIDMGEPTIPDSPREPIKIVMEDRTSQGTTLRAEGTNVKFEPL